MIRSKVKRRRRTLVLEVVDNIKSLSMKMAVRVQFYSHKWSAVRLMTPFSINLSNDMTVNFSIDVNL